MNVRLTVHFLPGTAADHDFAGKTAVVIDVLRATTTIVHAIAHGATAVFPCLEVNDAHALARQLPGPALLGGERGGIPITGFQLGNSPAEYAREHVSGKPIVFTTTNGTRAMHACRSAKRVVIAAFVNLSAVCRLLVGESEVAIVCAGTDGQITREDTLLAGAIAYEWQRSLHLEHVLLNDEAEISLAAWQSTLRELSSLKPLAAILRNSRGGRHLVEIGLAGDIDLAAQIDKFDIVPELDVQAWRIM